MTLSPQSDGQPLTQVQQEVACIALLDGFAQASRIFHTPPQKIRTWVQQKEQHRPQTWFWSTEKMAEWLLVQREQQLSVSLDTLVQMSREALGAVDRSSSFSWVLDFLLRHQLSLNPLSLDPGPCPRGRLPRSILANSRAFVEKLSPQVSSALSWLRPL